MADETMDPNLDIVIDCADPQKLAEFLDRRPSTRRGRLHGSRVADIDMLTIGYGHGLDVGVVFGPGG